MAMFKKRHEARVLRQKGYSINEIARKLEVSKRSVGRWCQNIKLTDQQEAKLWDRANINKVLNFKKYCEKRKRKTKLKIERLNQLGIKEIGKLNNREYFLSGVALYWAEGFKKDERLGFANSDPFMIKFFLKWLEQCGIKKEDIRLRLGININSKDQTKIIVNYWSKLTKIPLSHFNKTFYQKTVWKKIYYNRDRYHGVLRIRVNRSTDFLRKIKGWIKGLEVNI